MNFLTNISDLFTLWVRKWACSCCSCVFFPAHYLSLFLVSFNSASKPFPPCFLLLTFLLSPLIFPASLSHYTSKTLTIPQRLTHSSFRSVSLSSPFKDAFFTNSSFARSRLPPPTVSRSFHSFRYCLLYFFVHPMSLLFIHKAPSPLHAVFANPSSLAASFPKSPSSATFSSPTPFYFLSCYLIFYVTIYLILIYSSALQLFLKLSYFQSITLPQHTLLNCFKCPILCCKKVLPWWFHYYLLIL